VLREEFLILRTLNIFGDRTFVAAASWIWNSLLPISDNQGCHMASSSGHWRHLFGQWGHGAMWTFLTLPYRNILTYIHIRCFDVKAQLLLNCRSWCICKWWRHWCWTRLWQ